MSEPADKNMQEMHRDYGCVTNLGDTVAAVRTVTAQQKGSSLHVFLTSECVFSRNLGVICSLRGCLSLYCMLALPGAVNLSRSISAHSFSCETSAVMSEINMAVFLRRVYAHTGINKIIHKKHKKTGVRPRTIMLQGDCCSHC